MKNLPAIRRVPSVLLCAVIPSALALSAVAGCAPAAFLPAATSTPTRLPDPTQTATATFTPSPTATPQPTLTPTLFPTPAAVTFKFDAGVSAAQQQIVEQGIALGETYLGDAGALTVYAYANLDKLTEEYAVRHRIFVNNPSAVAFKQGFEEDVLARAELGVVYVYVSERFARSAVSARLATLTHEYFHAHQYYLSGFTGGQGAFWLIEGSAEYASDRALARYGLMDLERNRRREMDRTRGLTSPLTALETFESANAEDRLAKYTLGYLASEYLATLAGEEAVLNHYWSALRFSPGWRAAFQAAFKMSVEQFSAQFEDYRREKFPPLCGAIGEALPPAESTSGRIAFERQYAPGAFAIVSDSSYIPYTFCVKGFRLGAWTSSQLRSALILPTQNSSLYSCGGNCLILALSPFMPAGSYPLTLRLPDGTLTEIKFDHSVPTGTATPKP